MLFNFFLKLSFIQKLIVFTTTFTISIVFIFTGWSIIAPFVFSFILAYLLSPIVDRLETIISTRIAAVVTLFIIIISTFLFSLNFIIPSLVNEFNDLSTKIPFYIQKIQEITFNTKSKIESDYPFLQQYNLIDNLIKQIQDIIVNFVQRIPNFFISTFSTVSFLLLIPIILFFYLYQGPQIKRNFFQIIPNQFFEQTVNVFYNIGDRLSDYIRGILIETLIIAGLSIIFLLSVKSEYAFLLGTIAGVANIIPYIGPVVGTVPAILIFYLKMKTLNALLTITIGFIIIQAFDNAILKPIIYSQSADLHPLTVLFFIICGGIIAGVWGLILAVPFAVILKVSLHLILKELRFRISSSN